MKITDEIRKIIDQLDKDDLREYLESDKNEIQVGELVECWQEERGYQYRILDNINLYANCPYGFKAGSRFKHIARPDIPEVRIPFKGTEHPAHGKKVTVWFNHGNGVHLLELEDESRQAWKNVTHYMIHRKET